MAKRIEQTATDDAVTAAAEDGARLLGAVIDGKYAEGQDGPPIAADATSADEEEAAQLAGLVLLPTTSMTTAEMIAALAYPAAPHLLFGRAGDVTRMQPVPVPWRDFVLAGDRLRWAGNLEHVAGPEMGHGQVIDTVGLASGPDGPVLSVCNLSPFSWAAGTMFGFGPGAFIF